MEDDGERDAGDDRQGEAGRTSCSVTQALSASRERSVPERLRDLARRRDQERLEVERVGDHVELAASCQSAEQRDDDQRRRQPASASSRGPSCSAASARARARR